MKKKMRHDADGGVRYPPSRSTQMFLQTTGGGDPHRCLKSTTFGSVMGGWEGNFSGHHDNHKRTFRK